MIEIPESTTIGKQAEAILTEKMIPKIINATSPHSFTWYNGDPKEYSKLLVGRQIESIVGHGAFVSLHCDADTHITIGDGTNMKYYPACEEHPQKHQLLIVFDDNSFLTFTVSMYGAIYAYKGEFDNPYCQGSLEKTSPLDDAFDKTYFDSIFSSIFVLNKILLTTKNKTMSTNIYIGIILITLLSSCDTKQAPQVIYDETKSDMLTIDNVLKDTTKVLVTGMPVYLDSTNVLIHPIGWEDIYVKSYRNKIIDGSISIDYPRMSKDKVEPSMYSFGVNSNNKDYLSGEMVNLIFEDIETGKQRILTDKVMIITSAKYMKEVAKKIDRHYMFYSAHDKDYNRDGKLDYEDITAYYMSNLDGTNFTKITQDYHYFETSELMLKNNKYYFRTLEDVNKDGEFNKKDKYHYYYIDLMKDVLSPTEYFPLELMNVK